MVDKIVAAKSDLRNAQVDNIAQPSGVEDKTAEGVLTDPALH